MKGNRLHDGGNPHTFMFICGLTPPAKCTRAQIHYEVIFAESKECEKCEYRNIATIVIEEKTVLSAPVLKE